MRTRRFAHVYCPVAVTVRSQSETVCFFFGPSFALVAVARDQAVHRRRSTLFYRNTVSDASYAANKTFCETFPKTFWTTNLLKLSAMLTVWEPIRLAPKSPLGIFSSFNSEYVGYLSFHIMKRNTANPTNKWVPTTNMDAFLKPMLSYKIPLTDGPMKAPKANVLVQRPDIKPKVSKLFGKPYELKLSLNHQ